MCRPQMVAGLALVFLMMAGMAAAGAVLSVEPALTVRRMGTAYFGQLNGETRDQ